MRPPTALPMLLVLATSMAWQQAHADALRYFYCYAPDPAAGTVHVSPAMPIGPVAERAGYGAEFVAHLRRQGRLRGAATGYCVMRPSQDAVARAQSKLPVESCPECAGASHFQGVAWTRGGTAMPAPSLPRSPPAAVPTAAPADGTGADAEGPFLLVMGNRRSGRLLVIGNRADRAAVARQQARFSETEGWTTLLVSNAPGHGAAACSHDADGTRFFVSHAHASPEQAVSAARQFALQNRADPAQLDLCGAPWNAQRNVDAPQSRDNGAVEQLRQRIREATHCDPARGTCPVAPTPTGTGVRG